MPERYAICCMAEISPEAMNRFIKAEQKRNGEDDPQFFLFVDSMHKDYKNGPGKAVNEASSPHSPFLSKTLKECFSLVKELHDTKNSSVDPYAFAIMDAQSMEDDTVLIVDGKESCASVRAEFAMAIPGMMCWETGHSSVEDDIYKARKTEDNVLRYPAR